MPLPAVRSLALLLFAVASHLAVAARADDLAASRNRGRALYLANCSMCHQVNGIGSGAIYPPLANSDFLLANPTEAIRAVVSGYSQEIKVNGRTFQGQMPAALLTDAQVADVLNYILNSWGNHGQPVEPSQVAGVRSRTAFPTYEALAAANQFRPLPKAPEGFSLTEFARLPGFATRMASDGKGEVFYVLGQNGVVWRLDRSTRKFKQIISISNYVDLKPGEIVTLGMALDTNRRLWITANQRVDSRPWISNEVAILRTSAFSPEGDPIQPKTWFKTAYPYGIGPYNHGISDIKFGPDHQLYVSSGSRTDGGEPGEDPRLGKMGENEITACVWRLDPNATDPKLEIAARGIRNAYSLQWDGSGNLFTVSNGPDAHAPEEMDFITLPQPGRGPEHHGFPYQFSDAPETKKWYSHTPEPPAGVNFVRPVMNLGPDGLLHQKPTSTFTPHSSPAGMVWLGNDWPESVRNSFLIGRFGNLIRAVDDVDTGFDVLLAQMERNPDGQWAARMRTFLAPLGRPIDIHLAGKGRIYILEYTRPTDFKTQAGWLPGRILELSANPASH